MRTAHRLAYKPIVTTLVRPLRVDGEPSDGHGNTPAWINVTRSVSKRGRGGDRM